MSPPSRPAPSAGGGSNASVEAVLRTEELATRPSRPADYEAQTRALEAMAETLASSHAEVLKHLAEIAMQLCRADSAAVSVLDGSSDQVRLPVVVGDWAPYLQRRMPRDASPCEVVRDRGTTQLFTHPERHFPGLGELESPIVEALLSPFAVDGQANGTVWVATHDHQRRFDAEDERRLAALGRFASAAGRAMDTAARRSEEQLRLLADGTPALIWINGPDGAEFVNRTYLDFLGVEDADIQGFGWAEFIHPDDRDDYIQTYVRAVEERTTFDAEFRFRRHDGEFRWMRSVGQPRPDAHDDFRGYAGITMDVSRRKVAEDALRERQDQYALIIAGTEAAIRDWDVKAKRVMYSPRWKELRGFADDEIGDGEEEWSDGIHPEDLERVAGALQAHFDGRTAVFAEEYRVRHRNGHWIWILDRGIAQRDETGQVVRMAGSETDITARKQAEQDLRISEARHRRTLSLMPVAMYSCDASGVITYFNEQAVKLWGRTPQIGDTDERFCGSEQMVLPDGTPLPHHECPMAVALREGRAFRDREVGIRRPDGSVVSVLVNIDPVRDEHGAVIGAVNAFHDISGIKGTEAALRESEERFRMLADHMDQLAWICDETLGNAIWYNKRWFDYTGVGPEQMQDWHWSEAQHPDHIDRVVDRLQLSARTGTPWEDTFPLLGADGTYRWFLSRAIPIRDGDGKVVRWLGTNTDVTELRELQESLREADQRKDEFLAMLAHELRNPLAPIRMGLELMKVGEDDPAILAKTHATLERQTEQLVALVDDLLDVSRITRGKLDLRKTRVLLSDVVRSAVEASYPLMVDAGHELTVTVPDEPVLLDADPHRLAQVISNLLNNAARFTPNPGRIELVAGVEPGEVVVTVRDSGIGIPADKLDQIFELFTQLRHPQETTSSGLGIGLTLVRRLVDMHGGTVEVRSGGSSLGSEFTVRLPAVADPPSDSLPESRDGDPGRARPLRVLVVDDNRDAAETLSMVVEILGNEVRSAGDGEQALEVAREFRPDIILMDLGMPKMNGYEAAKRIREREWGRDVKLVALTGWGQDEDKQRTADAGFDHHLVKPAAPAELQRVIAALSTGEHSPPGPTGGEADATR